MKKRIFLRVFLNSVVLVLLALAIFSIYTMALLRQVAFQALTRGLTSAALTAKVAVAPLLAGGRGPELDSLARDIAAEGKVRITVMDPRGLVLADSEQDPAVMENHRLRPEMAAALEGKTGVSSRFSGTIRAWMIYVAVPISAAGRVVGVVRASSLREELDTVALSQSGGIVLVASLLFVLSLLAALALSRSLVAPLRDLAAVVERFSRGDFTARLHLRRRDEIRDLADEVNFMAERIQGLLRESADRAAELDGIFESVQQGIVLLDRDGRILRANPGFLRLAGTGEVLSKTLWELVRAPRLTEMIQQARTSGTRQLEELPLGDRWALCTVELMAASEQLIVVLQDASEQHRLAEVKRDFVINASHELRTPLTSIQGSLEMLEGGLEGDAARWVSTIRRNADRMSAIVGDLLLLSRLEARGAEPASAPMDIGPLAQDVVERFGQRARERGLGLSLSAPPSLPRIIGDPTMLEHLLVNLVDNALKYTEHGEVRVTLEPEGDGVRIEVADTGIGIPAESLPRIFERFYVVDQSRSRRMGGTGLGLSIVKHVVQTHGGRIEVHSQPGEGSRFIVHLRRSIPTGERKGP